MGAEPGFDALNPPTITPPAGPLGAFAFLNAFVRNPLRALPAGCWEQPITAIETPRAFFVWVTDPALIETVLLKEAERFPKSAIEMRIFGAALGEGLLTADGASWRRQRKAAAPAFRHSELVATIPAMLAAAGALVDRWRSRPPGSIVDVETDMTDVTFDIIAATVLGGCDAATARLVKDSADDYLDPISWDVGLAILGVPAWLWYPGKGRQRRAARRLRSALAAIVAERRRDARPHDDLLGRLMSAREVDGGAALDDTHLVDNLATFLLAGHETTAKALTWTLYLLARFPEWQEKLREEIATVVGARALAAADLDRLVLSEMVLKEAMRLYPPAPVMSRISGEATELAGVAIPKGTLITIPIYALHRHRLLWSDADAFDPTRFSPERAARIARTQFMPFGFGGRSCIGSAFAMIEAKVLLATFTRAASFDWDGRHAPEPVSRVTLRPKGGMPLKIAMR